MHHASPITHHTHHAHTSHAPHPPPHPTLHSPTPLHPTPPHPHNLMGLHSLKLGKLNGTDSLKLSRMALQQGCVQFIKRWLDEDKISCTEQLGNEIKPHDLDLALAIYHRISACNADENTPGVNGAGCETPLSSSTQRGTMCGVELVISILPYRSISPPPSSLLSPPPSLLIPPPHHHDYSFLLLFFLLFCLLFFLIFVFLFFFPFFFFVFCFFVLFFLFVKK
jgi:hypothetical protein